VDATEVNRPEIVAEVTAVFEAYERALIAHDLEALDAAFWDSDDVVRYGIADHEHGAAAIAAWRRATPGAVDSRRRLIGTVITTFGNDVATVSCRFVNGDEPGHGRQQQTWVRRPEGWRIVAAHVSFLPDR
jgi:hypothetical protein